MWQYARARKLAGKLSESELAQREYRNEKYSIAYRRKKANVDIQQVVKSIKNDINGVSVEDEYSSINRLDILENNIFLYQRFLHLRESTLIYCVFVILYYNLLMLF